MGQICKREHGSKRTALAALLATGMLAALVALIGLVAPSPAYAAELQGSGTEDDPVLIYSTDDLIAWCNKLRDMKPSEEHAQHARLMADLVDGHGGDVDDAVITKMDYPDFQAAELDGDNHLIRLKLMTHGGLFETGGMPSNAIATADIRNIHFVGSVSSNGDAGALFQHIGAQGGEKDDRWLGVWNCTNQATVDARGNAGGFIGSYHDDEYGQLSIAYCANFGSVTSESAHAGGMAGSVEQVGGNRRTAQVLYCSNNGRIMSQGGTFENRDGEEFGGSAGGIMGYLSYGSVNNFRFGRNYNQGAIESQGGLGYAGGLVGYLDTAYERNEISCCYNTGSIKAQSAADRAGGLIGRVQVWPYRVGITSSLTSRESLPAGAMDDNDHSGVVVDEAQIGSAFAVEYLDDHNYVLDSANSYTHSGLPVLATTGVGESFTVTLVSPVAGKVSYAQAYWNTAISPDVLSAAAYAPEGYRLAYWTSDAPDAGGRWSEPPEEFLGVVYGDDTLYAYCVPATANVKFDLNAPDGYRCSTDPSSVQKTIVEGEPVGALPTCTSVAYSGDKKDTRAFLGWATEREGSDPKAEWISESSDNLYDFIDKGTYEVTLYAQWANASLPFEIIRQPENYTMPAVAEGVSHEASFDFYTTYPERGSYDYWAKLQYREDRNSSYKDVENLLLSAAPNQFFFNLESAEEAIGDYRIKIEYYENGNLMGTLYTSSANVVMDIPQSEAEVTSIALGKDSEEDGVLGTHSYDVSLMITGDSKGEFPALVGDSPDKIEHKAWIEGGPDNILPEGGSSSSRLSIDNMQTAMLKNQHLKEGQTYTLCVTRLFHDSTYEGESEPYRVPFTVPYADSVAASITPVQVTEQPVVQDGKAIDFTADYEVPVNAPFNLASDVQYAQSQPEGREPSAQWQYSLGNGWVDVPDEFFARDEQGNPIRGIVWSDDRKSARVHATLNAKGTLDKAVFRVKLSTPPAPTDAISDQSVEKLSLSVPVPEITDLKVTNDTHVSLTWKWQDAEGNTSPTEGYYVKIERCVENDEWEEANGGRVYTYTYDATLDPQQKYRVSVSADTEGLHGSPTKGKEFTTGGKTGITWEDDYGACYLPSQHKNFFFNVDYDWADYNNGKHVASYTWYLSREKYADTMFDEFITTESDEARFPEDFETEDVENGKLWDPAEAQWVWVKAAVYNLDDEGNPADEIPETVRWASTLPIIHDTTEPQNLTTKDVGSHSMTVCWDAPAEGLVREYQVTVGGEGRSWVVPSEASRDGHYELKADGLNGLTSYDIRIDTIDSRKSPSTIATVSGEGTTLHSPEAGTWTAAANMSEANLGDELELSASYTAKSGKFPTKDVELQWYSWREGDDGWVSEGEPVTPMPPLDDTQEYTTTLKHTVTSEDYGRQWKLGVKTNSPDESVTGSSNVVTVAITPPAPTDVVCDTPAPTSIPVSWTPVADAEGYQIRCAKLDADGNPASATTYSAAVSSLTPDDAGKLHYEMSNLEPNTTYRVSVATFAHGVSSEFAAAPDVTTPEKPTIEAPVFSQVPKTTWVEAGKEATFTAQASVGDGGGAITYVWQRKGLGEQGFTPLADGDAYAISTDGATGVTTLTVKSVGAENAAAAFRCVATNSKDGQTSSTASASAYLTVTPVQPTNAKSWATSPTTGEVTWTAEGAVRRFRVTLECIANDGKKSQEPDRLQIVTISDDETQGWCQFDGLTPNSIYAASIDSSPQAGFWIPGKQAGTSFVTPPASALETATVTMSPDRTVVEPGAPVTFTVATNVDNDASETQEYRWQRNAFGEGWYDVDGGNAATLNVTAPEGGTVEGYRCIVTSTKDSSENVKDKKTVTSDVKLLATNVPVARPVELTAEPGTTTAHLSWASDDARPATYEVQYAEGPTPGDDAWTTVENAGASTSCDVEGLTPNTVYSWRVKAVVRDGLLQSDWALADTFVTLEEPSALAAVSVTPRWGATIAGSGKGVTYTATTNLDNVASGETLSYQWQESATGDEWENIAGQAKKEMLAAASDKAPRSCFYRCVVTASKDGVDLKTVTSEAASFTAMPQIPTALVAQNITAATADLSWTGSLEGGLSYRVFWRASGAADWQSATDLTETTYTLSSLMPATTYEWYVQVMNDGAPSVRSATSLFVTQSLSPVPTLTRVVVGPLDQTPAAAEQAKLTAYTNVDDMLDAGATLTYTWEMRDLDSQSWTTLAASTREITLPVNTVGYVRCTVTYTPASVLAQPSINAPVTSTNEARVRVMPASPANLAVAEDSLTQTSAKLTWTGDPAASGIAYDVTYSAVGSGSWQHVSTTDTEVVLDDLAPYTAYEWDVRAVAYGASDPLSSDWVTASPFATLPEEIVLSRVEVTPSATSVVVGAKRTIEITAKPDNTDPDENLAYQWQRYDGSEWQLVGGAAGDKLEVAANDLPVGTHAYRCEVTATRTGAPLSKKVISNESVVTVMPAAPTPLYVDDFHSFDPLKPLENVVATLHWEWDGPDDATFEVSYRKLAGAGSNLKGWVTDYLTKDDVSRTCQIKLDAPDLTYQWRVRAVQSGATSPWSEAQTFVTTLKEPADFSFVEVAPSDTLVSNDESVTVTLTASTNVDDDPNKGTLSYTWEWCELTTPDPRTAGKEIWKPIEGAASREITLSGNDRNRFVRCTVEQIVGEKTIKTVVSNPACVRTEPLPPYDLRTTVTTDGGIRLRWKCDDVRAKDDAQKNVIGYELNYRKVGSSEWAEEICNSKDCSLTSASLESGATYEWRVRTILSNDVGKSINPNTKLGKGGPHTEWVDGPAFTTAKVDVTPARATAVIGSGRTLTFTAMPNDVATGGGRETYEWQQQVGPYKWETLAGENKSTLSIQADKATAAGTMRYRCWVKANNDHTTSNEVTCTLAPAAPANLAASDVTSNEAKLAWDWCKGGLPSADKFNVFYRESGAKEWTTAEAVGTGDTHGLTIQGLKSETAYEWHVQAVQNGVESLPSSASLFVTASEHPDLKLESVLVAPADQDVAPDAQATLTATTNLDDMVDESTLAYTWEKRALDSDDEENSWQEIKGETNSSLTLPVKASGYVRCKVTYMPGGSTAPESVTSNEARVRVQPTGVPTGLEVKDIGDTTATFSWGGTLPDGGSFTLSYRPAGTDAWTTVTGLKASPCTATDLAPNTTYEWRMRTVSADGVASVWVDGKGFTTTSPDGELESVAVEPPSATAVAGDSKLVEDFLAEVSGTAEGQSLAYQWQIQLAGVWTNLPAETGERTHLSVAHLEAGVYSLRCAVTATAPGGKSKTVESDPVTLALSPMAPSDLDAREATRDTATLAWAWAGPGTVPSYDVQYREEGASDSDWVDVPADKIDAANMTCAVEGLASGTSYEWRVQAKQGGQVSEWAASGFVTLSGGTLKVARIWPPDVAVASSEQAKFAAFTNRGDAEDVSYAWQYRTLDSVDDESSWEPIEGETERIVTLDANTTGYVRCVATQGISPATEAIEVAEVAETFGVNESTEILAASQTDEAPATPEVAEMAEVSETLAAPAPVVVVSNQARVRVAPSVPNNLAEDRIGYRDAALSWAPADVDGTTFTLAYRAAGSGEWTELSGLADSAYLLAGLAPGTSYEWRVRAAVGEGDDALVSDWSPSSSFATLALKNYPVIAGADATWKPGQPGLSFTIDAVPDKFLSLAVDGVELALGTDYTLADDGMTVTLSPDYLAKLALGKHALLATFTDGTAATSFTVASVDPGPTPNPPNPNPPTPVPDNGGKALAPTGDPLGWVLATVGALGAACAALAAFTTVRNRRRR